jgi:hypothetical protein
LLLLLGELLHKVFLLSSEFRREVFLLLCDGRSLLFYPALLFNASSPSNSENFFDLKVGATVSLNRDVPVQIGSRVITLAGGHRMTFLGREESALQRDLLNYHDIAYESAMCKLRTSQRAVSSVVERLVYTQ